MKNFAHNRYLRSFLLRLSLVLGFYLSSISVCFSANFQCENIFRRNTQQIWQKISSRVGEAKLDFETLQSEGLNKVFADPKTSHELSQSLQATLEEYRKSGDLDKAVFTIKYRLKLTHVQTYKLYFYIKDYLLTGFADFVYRPALEKGRAAVVAFGRIWQTYVSGKTSDLAAVRWKWVTGLFKNGADIGSFGHTQIEGLAARLAKTHPPSLEQVAQYRKSIRKVGNSVELGDGQKAEITPYELSPMISVSGMSYPQLSVNAVLSLLYTHVSLAKKGIRYTFNTGEGGPLLHLFLLNKSAKAKELASAVTRYAIDAGFAKSKFRQAEIEVAVERIIKERDELFKDFSQEDLNKAQIIAQIGSALNGVRDKEERIRFAQLMAWAKNPFYAGTQLKLGQAAKKGAKVDASKMSPLAVFLRDVSHGKAVIAPDMSIEWESLEALAETILIIKFLTGKPVSIKMPIGNAEETYQMMEYLSKMNALPDSIQLDGSGFVRAPGSGNAPFIGNTNYNILTSIMLMDVILKDLGIREKIFVESTGDIITSDEALIHKSLGADGVAAARLWLGMGVGCTLIMNCATGKCYNGIASPDSSLFSKGLDPKKVAPRGTNAAEAWYLYSTRGELESRKDWNETTPFRTQTSLLDPDNPMRIRTQFGMSPLSEIFHLDEIIVALRHRVPEDKIKTYLSGPLELEAVTDH